MELILSALLLALTASASVLRSTDVLARDDQIRQFWPRWSGIKHMFVFGDSYTETGFDVHGTQPSAANPLGNPDYPGYTSSNGPNWIDFLTTTYNETFVKTINLAFGGAVVDEDLIPVHKHKNPVKTIKDQINDEYLPIYASHPSFFDWRSEDTLFAIWIGINDIGFAHGWSNNSAVFPLVIAQYSSLVDKLYKSGAKNFLFLFVPPIDRAPEYPRPESKEVLKGDIASWNNNVASIAAKLSNTYKDATTFVFDTNALYNQVLDNPSSHEQTAPIMDTTSYCQTNTKCKYPIDEYFWLNSLHPTFRIHNVTAQEIAKHLS